jgi:hypothetical protein
MHATLTFTTEIEGSLVDAGTLTLADPAAEPTYGVKRNDTDEVVLAAGTVVPRISVGTFQIEFDEPAEDIWYTVWENWEYAGVEYHIEHTYFASHTGDSRIPAGDRIELTGAVLVSPVSVFNKQRPWQFYEVE